jgi:hypothetical protein
MGGKNKTSPAKVDSAMEAQLAALTANIGQLCGKIDNLEKSLHELCVENTVVREELAAARKDIVKRDETIANLTKQVNRLDQDARASSLRIVGLPIDAATPPTAIPEIVFREVILPTVASVKAAGDLPPSVNPILQYTINQAFAIPSKKGKSYPVIVKLASQHTRSLIFKHKKTALPSDRDLATNKVRSRYAIYEDLTPANHAQFRTLSADPRVKSIWSYGGQIRLKSYDSETVYKVRSLGDTADSLLKPSPSAMLH